MKPLENHKAFLQTLNTLFGAHNDPALKNCHEEIMREVQRHLWPIFEIMKQFNVQSCFSQRSFVCLHSDCVSWFFTLVQELSACNLNNHKCLSFYITYWQNKVWSMYVYNAHPTRFMDHQLNHLVSSTCHGIATMYMKFRLNLGLLGLINSDPSLNVVPQSMLIVMKNVTMRPWKVHSRALHLVPMGAHLVHMGAQRRPNGRLWAQNVGLWCIA